MNREQKSKSVHFTSCLKRGSKRCISVHLKTKDVEGGINRKFPRNETMNLRFVDYANGNKIIEIKKGRFYRGRLKKVPFGGFRNSGGIIPNGYNIPGADQACLNCVRHRTKSPGTLAAPAPPLTWPPWRRLLTLSSRFGASTASPAHVIEDCAESLRPGDYAARDIIFPCRLDKRKRRAKGIGKH